MLRHAAYQGFKAACDKYAVGMPSMVGKGMLGGLLGVGKDTGKFLAENGRVFAEGFKRLDPRLQHALIGGGVGGLSSALTGDDFLPGAAAGGLVGAIGGQDIVRGGKYLRGLVSPPGAAAVPTAAPLQTEFPSFAR